MDDDERAGRDAEIAENPARIENLTQVWEILPGTLPPAVLAGYLNGLGAATRAHMERCGCDPQALSWMGLYLEFWAGQVGKCAELHDAEIAEWAEQLDPDAASTKDG